MILLSLAAICVFVGIVAGGLAIGYLIAPLDARGHVDGDWMLGAGLLATALGTAAMVGLGRATGRRDAERVASAHRAQYERIQAAEAARLDSLRAELRAVPELAHYATIVAQAPWLSSVEEARKREQLVQRLRSDPRTAPHAERAFRGEMISAAQIAHWLDSDQPVTCMHMRPVEQALRALQDGFVLVDDHHLRVNANLADVLERLQAAGATSLEYEQEVLHPGRGSDFYAGGQSLHCSACNCRLDGSAFGPALPAWGA